MADIFPVLEGTETFPTFARCRENGHLVTGGAFCGSDGSEAIFGCQNEQCRRLFDQVEETHCQGCSQKFPWVKVRPPMNTRWGI